jgi:hypothetical protein
VASCGPCAAANCDPRVTLGRPDRADVAGPAGSHARRGGSGLGCGRSTPPSVCVTHIWQRRRAPGTKKPPPCGRRPSAHRLKSDRNPRIQRESGRQFRGRPSSFIDAPSRHRSFRRAGRSTWDRRFRRTGSTFLPRKEVIQPHLPVRLPCYDFVPITNPTFDGCLLAVGPPASGVIGFHDVTGGVYKAREHIHRSVLTCGY